MTITRSAGAVSKSRDFAIVGVGGGGAHTASEMAQIVGNAAEVILVDREIEEMNALKRGRKFAIGYPMFPQPEDEHDDTDIVDSSDLFRLGTALSGVDLVFVMAGLGGTAANELMPSVLRTAMSTCKHVLAIVTLPFTFEGRGRTSTAQTALDRIKATGCSLALINADKSLSAVAQAGTLADELSAAKARVVMNVLSASGTDERGSLNPSEQLLEAIQCTGETFVSYAASEDASDFRKVARQAIKKPLTDGLDLADADLVSVVVAGPHDMPIKSLNAIINIIQSGTSDEAAFSTSFIANETDDRSKRIRVSVLAGKRDQVARESFQAEKLPKSLPVRDLAPQASFGFEPSSVETDDDLIGAPDWLVDSPRHVDREPALV